MDQPPKSSPEEIKPLTGREGLDLLKSSASSVEGVQLVDFLKTPEGQEAMKNKKIVLAGPPRSGKSCLRQGLKEAIKEIGKEEVYPYVLTACPDGEGAWFQESMNNNPELASKYKAEYKSKFSPEFAQRIAESVKNLSLPLNFIDIGGVISPENVKICEKANGAILLCGETAVKNNLPAEWKKFFTGLKIPIVAEVYSDYKGTEDIVEGTGEDGVFRGSVHHLERGEMLQNRETIRALSEFIINLGKEKSPNLSMEEIKTKVEVMTAEWQKNLPEMKIILGGSLASGLFVLDENTKMVDVDIRFLFDEPVTEETIKKVEATTGLAYRKKITVSDWPSGQSEGYMIEGKINLPGMDLPLDVEGCLRNGKYVGWGKYYKDVLSSEEISAFIEEKKKLRNDKIAYKALKQKVLGLVISRAIEKGIVTPPESDERY